MSRRNKALFLVAAPFHVTCIQEAIRKFSLEHVHIVNLFTEHGENHQQVKSKINQLTNTQVTTDFIDYTTVAKGSLESRINIYAKHIPALQKQRFNMVFFSDFRSVWQQDIVETLAHPNTYLLDDGAVTLAFLKYYRPINKIFSIPQNGTPERIQQARHIKSKLGIKIGTLSNIKIFTIFSHLAQNDPNIVANNLSHLSKHFISIDKTTDLILGSKLVSRAFMSFEDYDLLIKSIMKCCRGKNILYAPHRGQDPHISQQLVANNPQLQLLNANMPVEDWLGRCDAPPARIHGYCSTAFYILNLIYPQLSLHCYSVKSTFLEDFDNFATWGSTLFKNSDMVRLELECMPETVKVVQL